MLLVQLIPTAEDQNVIKHTPSTKSARINQRSPKHLLIFGYTNNTNIHNQTFWSNEKSSRIEIELSMV